MQDPSSKEKTKDASASFHRRLLDRDSGGKESFIFGTWFPESNSNQKLSDHQRKELSQKEIKRKLGFGDPVLLINLRGWIPCRSSKRNGWKFEEDEGGSLHASRVGSRRPARAASRGWFQDGRWLEFWLEERSRLGFLWRE